MKKLYDKLITDHYNSVAAKFKKSKLSTIMMFMSGMKRQNLS